MVNIFIYGLDQFVVGEISSELTTNLAKVMEIDEDEINFIAPHDMVFHKGVEQTSWRVLVEVKIPQTFEKIQNQIRQVILHYVSEVAVHVEVLFYYFAMSEHYQFINEEYDPYLTEDDAPRYQNEDTDEVYEGEGDDEVYTGDIFQDYRNDDGEMEFDDEVEDARRHH